MNDRQIALAYCIDNIRIAEEFEDRISSNSPYQFEHVYCTRDSSEPSIAEKLADFDGPILLVLSDNFLKSAQCMKKGLSLLQNKGSQVLPIVADGYAKDEETGKLIKTETNFERVSDIIQYINYWQDQYLDLRRQKRQIGDMDEEKFNAHLKVMREISSEAGEFLRLVRNMNYLTAADFKSEHFKKFFEFMDDLDTWETFQIRDREYVAASREPEAAISEEEQEEQEEMAIDLAPTQETASPESDDTSETEAPEMITPSEEEEPAPETENIDSILEKAEALAQEGRHEISLDLLREACERFPDNTMLRYRFALSLAQKQEYIDHAGAQLEEILEAEPGHIDALFLTGELAEVSGDFPKARKYYEEVAGLAPDRADIFYRIGILLANHFPEDALTAADAFQRSIQLAPDTVDTHYQYALLLNESLGRPDKAAEFFKMVLEKQPDHPFANYDLALLYHGQGNSKTARDYYLKAAEVNPELKTEENDLAFEINAETTTNELEIIEEIMDLKTPPSNEPESPDTQEEESSIEVTFDQSEELPEEVFDEELEESFVEPEAAAEALEVKASSNGKEQPADFSENPLKALKENIRRLEEMLQSQPDPVAEKAPEPLPGQGKIAMITGSTSALGKTVAQTFAEQGYRLILSDRDAEKISELETFLKEHHDVEITPLPLDIRSITQIEEAIKDKLTFEWRQIDVLVNCAVKSSIGLESFYKSRLDRWDELIDVNLKGALYIIRAVIQYMVKKHQGHIINVETRPSDPDKGNDTAKQLFSSFVEMLRSDVRNYNIKLSTITLNDPVMKTGDDQDEPLLSNFISPRDIAETIAYVASTPAHLNVPNLQLSAMKEEDSSFSLSEKAGSAFTLSGKINPFN